MSQYFNGDEERLSPGIYQLVYNSASSGTGTLAISKDSGTTFQDMVDGSFTTSEDRVMYHGGGILRFTLTGDAKIYLDKIQ